jgi:signal transduction histidine kinase
MRLTRAIAGGGDNGLVNFGGARERWRRIHALLRPEQRGDPLPRSAVAADTVFAVLLTVVALFVAARANHTEQVPFDPGSRWPPVPPLPGGEIFSVESHYTPWPLTVFATLPLALRRKYPLVTFWVLLGAASAIHREATWVTLLVCVVGGYSAMVHSRYRTQAIASLATASVVAGYAFRNSGVTLPGWSGPFFVLLVAAVLAYLVRSWRQRYRDGQRRFAELEQAQEAAMRRAVAEERARIAAELHDVVSHNVGVMVIQTGAARTVLDTMPELAKEAMIQVEASGRSAMSELRHVMGLLSAAEHERLDGYEPQPGLEQLKSLVERVRATGVTVLVEIKPPPGPLPAGVELAVYRVVQEALTNTLKHAEGARANVMIGHDGDWLEVEITDSGGIPGDAARSGNGRGLIGLRERLAVYGGTLESGRSAAGGYRLFARVPWSS